jgi:hypothetical protein
MLSAARFEQFIRATRNLQLSLLGDPLESIRINGADWGGVKFSLSFR